MPTRCIKWSGPPRSYDSQLFHQLRVLVRIERLRPVAERMIGVVMHFHKQIRRRPRRLRPAPWRGPDPLRPVPCDGSARSANATASGRPGWRKYPWCCACRFQTCGCRARTGSLHNCRRRGLYSADSSSSSMVAEMPRFSSTGLPQFPQFAQQVEILHVARTDLQNVGVSRQQGICEASITSLMTKSPRRSAASASA